MARGKRPEAVVPCPYCENDMVVLESEEPRRMARMVTQGFTGRCPVCSSEVVVRVAAKLA